MQVPAVATPFKQYQVKSITMYLDLLRLFAGLVGIATIAALVILIEMPERGAIENKAAATLAGLPPIAPESGRKTR